MMKPLALILLCGCTFTDVAHRPLTPVERVNAQEAIRLLDESGFRQEAGVLAEFLRSGKLVASRNMGSLEMYEKFYFALLTLEEWIHVCEDILSCERPDSPDSSRGIEILSSWLLHACRHALGDGEAGACTAQERFEATLRRNK